MNFLSPPAFLADRLPEGLRSFAGLAWYGILGLGVLVVLFVLMKLLRGKSGGKGKASNLEEKLGDYPALKPFTGDRRLLIEGVPVRLRLVVIAPAGEIEVDEENIPAILDKVVPGLGTIFKQDKPRVRVWPRQLSYEGFTKHFHRNAIIPEGEGEESPWACVAGRAKLPKGQFMLGLALQGIKPNTVGRRTVDSHEWASVLRVKVRE